MKIHNYEKKSLILYISILLVLIELLLFVYLKDKKIFQYEKITGYVIHKNEILITPTTKARKILYKNQRIFIKNHSLSFEIKEDKGVVLESQKKRYYELILKTKIPSNTNQTIEISVKKGKKDILTILKSVWKGE